MIIPSTHDMNRRSLEKRLFCFHSPSAVQYQLLLAILEQLAQKKVATSSLQSAERIRLRLTVSHASTRQAQLCLTSVIHTRTGNHRPHPDEYSGKNQIMIAMGRSGLLHACMHAYLCRYHEQLREGRMPSTLKDK